MPFDPSSDGKDPRSRRGASLFGDDDITPLPAPAPMGVVPARPAPAATAAPTVATALANALRKPTAAPAAAPAAAPSPGGPSASAPVPGERPVAPAIFVVELPAAGDLSQIDAPRIVAWAIATGYSGCLWLAAQANAAMAAADAARPASPPSPDGPTLPGGTALPGELGPSTPDVSPHRELYFENGALIGAFSTIPGDGLVDYLAPLWSRPQLQRARYLLSDIPLHRLHQQLGRLCEAQLLNRKAATSHLVSYIRELCCRAVSIGPGRYRVLARAITRDERLDPPLPVRRLLVEGLRQGVSLEFLQRRLGSQAARLRPMAVIGATEGGAALADIGLSAAEEKALSLFDGQHNLGEIMRKAALGEHAVYTLAYALVCLGALGVRGSIGSSPRALAASLGSPLGVAATGGGLKGSGAPKTSPSPKSSPSIQLTEADLAVRRIQQRYRLVEEGDYFTLLDLPQTASTAEILRAHQALRADFAPSALPYRARTSMDRELRQIARALDEARIVLGSDESRRTYTLSLSAP